MNSLSVPPIDSVSRCSNCSSCSGARRRYAELTDPRCPRQAAAERAGVTIKILLKNSRHVIRADDSTEELGVEIEGPRERQLWIEKLGVEGPNQRPDIRAVALAQGRRHGDRADRLHHPGFQAGDAWERLFKGSISRSCRWAITGR